MHLGRETIRRQPSRHRIRFKESSIDFLGLCSQNAVQSNSVFRGHNISFCWVNSWNIRYLPNQNLKASINKQFSTGRGRPAKGCCLFSSRSKTRRIDIATLVIRFRIIFRACHTLHATSPAGVARGWCAAERLVLGGAHQFSRMAESKCQVRRISITSKSRASAGGNTG